MGEYPASGLGQALGDLANRSLQHGLDIASNPLNLYATAFAHAVLTMPLVQDIEFETPTVKVDRHTFQMVLSAIVKGNIRVILMDATDPDRQVGAAVYVSGDNLLKLSSVDLRRDRSKSSIIHESVHASHDILKRSDLSVWSTEQAAYIAEAVLARLMPAYAEAQRVPQFLQDPESAAYNALFRPAWNLAVKIVDQGIKKIPGNDVDLLNLFSAIQQAKPYQSTWADKILADGI